MHSCRGLILILGVLVTSWAQAAPLPDDQEALQGTWQGVQSGIVFRCTFGQLFAFVAEGPNVQLDSTGLGYELKVEGKYTIRKPEVVITSASVQNLYANCGNTINVDCPALGEFYNPKFTATEAQVLPSSTDKRVITIVPTGKTCVLGVSSLTNGQNIKIDDIKYKVIKPPRPEIVLEVLGKEYNGATPIPAKADCKVKIRPDNDFRNALPKDSRYVIDVIDLLSARSLGAPTKVASFSGNGKDAVAGVSCALGNSLKGDPPGTKIFFKVGAVYRMNFQNKKIEEQFGDRDLYIGAIVK